MDVGKSVDAIYADFSKAFDIVNHTILLDKLEGDSRENNDDAGGSKRKTASFRTLDTYFTKKPKLGKSSISINISNTGDNMFAVVASTSSATLNVNEENCTPATDAVQCMPIACTSTSNSDQINSSVSESEFSLDIGAFVGKNIEDSKKAMLLENHWVPPLGYTFPESVTNRKGKQIIKRADKSLLDKFDWLVFSDKDQGFYCKYCVLFGPEGSMHSKRQLKRLVKNPLKAFDYLLSKKGVLLTHQRHEYHKFAVNAGIQFLSAYKTPGITINNQMINETVSAVPEVNNNRERLRPIVETIIFCGQQNISLHDNDDDGKLLNEGNLRALLKFRKQSSTLHILKNSNSNAKNKYIDKTGLNQLIDVCEEIIQENIFQNVKKAKYFSILFNETTDITSQLYLSVRYLHDDIVKEDFVTFYGTLRNYQVDDNINEAEHRLTGVALAKIVENICLKFHIDLTWCVGIGIDSCVAMTSEIKVAVKELSKKAVHAKYYPYTNQVLNSSLATSCKVISCRNASGIMRKVITFVNTSTQMRKIFEKELGVTLQGIREMCWIERHDKHQLFEGDNLVKICCVLKKISTWQNNQIAYDAHCLLQLLCSPDFIVSSICLSDILDTTVSLSKLLQKSSIDLKRTTDTLSDTLSVLRRKKGEADTNFRKLFEGAMKVAKQLGVEIKCSIIVSIQKANHKPAQSTEEYFRTNVYVPLLDSVINDLKERLSPEVLNFFKLGVFLPNFNYNTEDIETVKEIANRYKLLLHNTTVPIITNEYQRWVANWQRNQNVSQSISNLIEKCDAETFTNIKEFLRILATLPVSEATAESSASHRRLKTWLRTSKAEDRLTGLALLYVHKKIPIEVDKVITRFERRR